MRTLVQEFMTMPQGRHIATGSLGRKIHTDGANPKIQDDRLGRWDLRFLLLLLSLAIPMKILIGMPRIVTIVEQYREYVPGLCHPIASYDYAAIG